MSLVSDSELALSKGVPELDGLVSGPGDDLSVVSGESYRENLLGVANKSAFSLAGLDVPQSKGTIPRGTQAELAIRRDHNVLNEVRVSNEGLDGESIVAILASQLPNEDSLVSRCRQQKLWVFWGSGEGSNPARVANQLSSLFKMLTAHFQ